ncbi:hypothetical protein DMB38_11925 [Streptomyces sp. WAC 06738]|nr:hypothetical protein DMB38_11925 [Streptomyces sp. WAC 06738]
MPDHVRIPGWVDVVALWVGSVGGTEARRHGGTEARRHGGTEARRSGGTEVWRPGGTDAPAPTHSCPHARPRVCGWSDSSGAVRGVAGR